MKPPLLLIGHATDEDGGVAEFGRFVHRMRCRLDHLADVSGAFVGRARPSLRESIAALVARGHHRFVALPVALQGEGRLLAGVPGELALERARHPVLEYDYGPLVPAEGRVLNLLAERLADAAAEVPRLRPVSAASGPEPGPAPVAPGETAIVLVGRGSPDPAANADVHRVSRLLWETRAADYLTVETAFVTEAAPGVPGGLERCRRLGAKRAIVLPYLLFAGGLLERVWTQAMAYAAGHPGMDVRCAEAVGDCDGLADVLIDHYEAVLTGSPA